MLTNESCQLFESLARCSLDMNSVRQRALPSPASAGEFAYKPVLETLLGSAAALMEEAKAAVPDITRVAEMAEEVGRACTRLARRWGRLEVDSPYRAVGLDIPIASLEDILETVRGKPNIEDASDVDAELADLLALRARLTVSANVATALSNRGLSIRGVAKEHGFSSGHLSDIRMGKAGLPTEEVCERLDAALGTKLKKQVEELRARAEELRGRSRERRQRRTRTTQRAASIGPRDHAKLRSINIALLDDQSLLDLVEALTSLPASARKGIHALVRELREEE